MPDYKKMYLHMVRESERAMDIIIEAQLECEQMCAGAQGAEAAQLPLEQKEEDEPH